MLIVYGSLYPWTFEMRHVAGGPIRYLFHRWDYWGNQYLIRDMFANLVLYMPLGLSGSLAFGKRMAVATVLLAFAFSVSLEMAQIYLPTRQASMVDVLCNTGGAAIGATIGLAARIITAPGAVLLVAGYLTGLLFPLAPLRPTVITGHNTALFLHSPLISSFPGPLALAIWYAAGLLLRAADVRFARKWLALSLLVLLAQIHVIEQPPLIRETAGAAAGVILFALRPDASRVKAWEAGGFLLSTAIAGLWPFHFSILAQNFSMVPFEGLITADGPTGLWIVLSQLVTWGTAVWLFSAAGMRRWPAIALVAGVVAAAQLARVFVPDATPGITAPLLALIAGFVLDAIETPARGTLTEPQTQALQSLPPLPGS